ncbi:hypothetical protein [Snodgrassella sp. ESL0253]|nr:hypothetical protein [Snodgrassella sp. ESL0253]
MQTKEFTKALASRVQPCLATNNSARMPRTQLGLMPPPKLP